MSQAVVASGRSSPSNLLRLQPKNQKVCSAPRQGRLHPGWSRKGQGGKADGSLAGEWELQEWGRDGVWSQGVPRRAALPSEQ